MKPRNNDDEEHDSSCKTCGAATDVPNPQHQSWCPQANRTPGY